MSPHVWPWEDPMRPRTGIDYLEAVGGPLDGDFLPFPTGEGHVLGPGGLYGRVWVAERDEMVARWFPTTRP